MVREVGDLTEFSKILNEAGGRLVVVDFTALWCPPCKRIGPIFLQLSNQPENNNVIFLKVDVDKAADVASSCGISGMPTFHFYKNGKKVDEFTGADEGKLIKTVAKHR